MKFGKNVMPFNAWPIKVQNSVRNMLSSLFLDVLESGGRRFTARLCHHDQLFKETVCENLELQGKKMFGAVQNSRLSQYCW
jgi:hypothetical protein